MFNNRTGRAQGVLNKVYSTLGHHADDPGIEIEGLNFEQVVKAVEEHGFTGKKSNNDIKRGEVKVGKKKRLPCRDKNCEKSIRVVVMFATGTEAETITLEVNGAHVCGCRNRDESEAKQFDNLVIETAKENKDLKRNQILIRINRKLPANKQVKKTTKEGKALLKRISYLKNVDKKANLPAQVVTLGDLERGMDEIFPADIEDAKLHECAVIDYKIGSNKKGDQFVAVLSSPALLQNAIEQKKAHGKSFLIADTLISLF